MRQRALRRPVDLALSRHLPAPSFAAARRQNGPEAQQGQRADDRPHDVPAGRGMARVEAVVVVRHSSRNAFTKTEATKDAMPQANVHSHQYR